MLQQELSLWAGSWSCSRIIQYTGFSIDALTRPLFHRSQLHAPTPQKVDSGLAPNLIQWEVPPALSQPILGIQVNTGQTSSACCTGPTMGGNYVAFDSEAGDHNACHRH